jgi:hypothetical protein
MPKSRGRKNRRQRQRATRLKLTERSLEILEGQRQRFKEKFGREWGQTIPSSSILMPPSRCPTDSVAQDSVNRNRAGAAVLRAGGSCPPTTLT